MNIPFSGFTFGFADVSWAEYYSSLPDDMKSAVERHANEFHSIEDMKRFISQLQNRE